MFGYVTDPFAPVTLDGSFFWMLRSDTRAIGRVLDVVCYDLSVTKAMYTTRIQIGNPGFTPVTYIR